MPFFNISHPIIHCVINTWRRKVLRHAAAIAIGLSALYCHTSSDNVSSWPTQDEAFNLRERFATISKIKSIPRHLEQINRFLLDIKPILFTIPATETSAFTHQNITPLCTPVCKQSNYVPEASFDSIIPFIVKQEYMRKKWSFSCKDSTITIGAQARILPMRVLPNTKKVEEQVNPAQKALRDKFYRCSAELNVIDESIAAAHNTYRLSDTTDNAKQQALKTCTASGKKLSAQTAQLLEELFSNAECANLQSNSYSLCEHLEAMLIKKHIEELQTAYKAAYKHMTENEKRALLADAAFKVWWEKVPVISYCCKTPLNMHFTVSGLPYCQWCCNPADSFVPEAGIRGTLIEVRAELPQHACSLYGQRKTGLSRKLPTYTVGIQKEVHRNISLHAMYTVPPASHETLFVGIQAMPFILSLLPPRPPQLLQTLVSPLIVGAEYHKHKGILKRLVWRYVVAL